MDRPALAALLVAADDAGRAALLAEHAPLADAALASALKALFDDTKISAPRTAQAASAALLALSATTGDDEVHALAAWTAGLAALQIAGQPERALVSLDEAAARFNAAGQPLKAASTLIGRLHGLALLGRHDEAIAVGLAARDTFVAHGDLAAAGRIEHNLGNVHARRDEYREAAAFFRRARERFAATGDETQLMKIDIGLANVLALQHQFREATTLYDGALAHAEAAGLEVAQAALECDLGCLELFQGRYDRALDLLERSRRRYAALGMPHKSANADKELADAYLELNLAPEAAAIYERVVPQFAALGMRADRAAALTNYGRALLLLGRLDEAGAVLDEARAAHAAEGNSVGAATVTLTDAFLGRARGEYEAAAGAAADAAAALEAGGTVGRWLLARWLHGEATRALGRATEARAVLTTTLGEATRRAVPQVAQRCQTSLGLLAADLGDAVEAESWFKRAVAQIESLRAPLPAEEFRTAFVSDKLVPYTELVRLCLADRTADRAIEAFGYVERARSRALVDVLGGAIPIDRPARDAFEEDLLARLEELRADLNWFYSQINRPAGGEAARGATAVGALHAALREREEAVLTITRQLQQRGIAPRAGPEPIDIGKLRDELGHDIALVEYFGLDGDLLAFVVTDAGVEVVGPLGSAAEVEASLAQLRFQLDALRYGAERVRGHLAQLTARTQHHLAALYDRLLRPIDGRLGARRLVVVPFRALHYVPFQALHDGTAYLIERREVCYAPSASVLSHCLARPRRGLTRAAFFGVAAADIPRVRDEVAALAPLFPGAATLLDGEATLAALRREASAADVLHLACHGQFRPDNPLFSSLRLGDGWLTARDACALDLRCELVTLSACETGVSAVAPGDELIGLARGFLSAGAPALLVSLWAVDDGSTATLMARFYAALRAGASPAAALRRAQCALLAEQPHPYFWSAFSLVGRW